MSEGQLTAENTYVPGGYPFPSTGGWCAIHYSSLPCWQCSNPPVSPPMPGTSWTAPNFQFPILKPIDCDHCYCQDYSGLAVDHKQCCNCANKQAVIEEDD